MFHTHLHVFVDHIACPLAEIVVEALEKCCIYTTDVVLAIHRVVYVQILEKEFLARLPYLLERIDSVDGQRDFGQRGCDLPRERILAVRGIDGEIDLARKVSLLSDTRLEGITQLLGGVGSVVLVEVRAYDIDVSRETVTWVSFGILFVRPSYLEVGAFLIVGSAFGANLVDGKT